MPKFKIEKLRVTIAGETFEAKFETAAPNIVAAIRKLLPTKIGKPCFGKTQSRSGPSRPDPYCFVLWN